MPALHLPHEEIQAFRDEHVREKTGYRLLTDAAIATIRDNLQRAGIPMIEAYSWNKGKKIFSDLTDLDSFYITMRNWITQLGLAQNQKQTVEEEVAPPLKKAA